MVRVTCVCVLALVTSSVRAGPYSRHSADPLNPFDAPISSSDRRIFGWVTQVIEYVPAPGVIGNDDPSNALASADGETVSLGDLIGRGVNEPPIDGTLEFDDREPWNGDPNDPDDQYGFLDIDPVGSITLGFSEPLTNRPGPDFAVFENSFDNSFSSDADTLDYVFAEFGYVEVSSDGNAFARFASVSTHTEADLDIEFGRNFAALEPTNVLNLAGKHLADWGTPFDLDDLALDTIVRNGQVDLSAIRFVRIVDIPGSGDFFDSAGHPIFDSWVGVNTGGFDLDAIALLPEPGTGLILALAATLFCQRRKR